MPSPHSIFNMFIILLNLVCFLKFSLSNEFSRDLVNTRPLIQGYVPHSNRYMLCSEEPEITEQMPFKCLLIKHPKCQFLIIYESIVAIIFSGEWDSTVFPRTDLKIMYTWCK